MLTVLPAAAFLSAKAPTTESVVTLTLSLSLPNILPSVKAGATEKVALVLPSYSRLATVPVPGVDVNVSGRGSIVR